MCQLRPTPRLTDPYHVSEVTTIHAKVRSEGNDTLTPYCVDEGILEEQSATTLSAVLLSRSPCQHC